MTEIERRQMMNEAIAEAKASSEKLKELTKRRQKKFHTIDEIRQRIEEASGLQANWQKAVDKFRNASKQVKELRTSP
jgi:hypothetical protein